MCKERDKHNPGLTKLPPILRRTATCSVRQIQSSAPLVAMKRSLSLRCSSLWNIASTFITEHQKALSASGTCRGINASIQHVLPVTAAPPVPQMSSFRHHESLAACLCAENYPSASARSENYHAHQIMSSSRSVFLGGRSPLNCFDVGKGLSLEDGIMSSTNRPFSSNSRAGTQGGFMHNKHRNWDEDDNASVQSMYGQSRSQLGAEASDREVEEAGSTAVATVSATEYYIPVKAFYIARSLDIRGLVNDIYKAYPSHMVRNNVIVRFPDRTGGAGTSMGTAMGGVPYVLERYMVAFHYGSLVFLNFDAGEQDAVLNDVQPFCDVHFRGAHKDDYGVVLRPKLAGWSEGGQDHIMVKQLDMNNIRVISSVLGQSVALEFHAKKVDEMVNTFSELNRGMEQTGTFTMKRKKLFQLVAAANTTLADVILRLGLLERSDAAWKHAHYAKIWEYLRDDFEMDERFESLDFKLNIIQHNVRFFLDILQNRKSDTLEWIIILLIAGEICLGLYEIVNTAMKQRTAVEGPKLVCEFD